MNAKINELAKRVKQNPKDILSKFALGLELIKVDEVQKARMLFEYIVREHPEYIGVYYHLGALYESINENKKALQTYKEGIKMAQSLKDVHAANELMASLNNLTLELEEE